MIATTNGVQTADDIQRIFDLQKANQYKVGNTTAKERKAKLKRLSKGLMKYRPEIREALFNDYRKPAAEVDLTEIFPVTGEIKHTSANLSRWMRPHRVGTPMALMGSSSWVHYESKGVVLIISPWNFPVQLTFGPLVSAIAAGNSVILKPSEHTPHASALMKKIIGEIFDENEVALVEGAVETSTRLLELPFNHIFFTGSPAIGKIVMAAAAKNLASVTLELGGKSPSIIDKTANLETAARRTAWVKFMNNGQICIAPDYIFVHESRKDQFVDLVGKNIRKFFGKEVSDSPDYNRMVNKNHFTRVKKLLEDAVDKGAKIEYGGKFDDSNNYIEPTLVTNVDMDSSLMREEIFGPVLPIHTFRDIREPIEVINSGEKPLALYIYSQSRKNIHRILKNTRAGGTSINHTGLHFYNHNLPFGGTNNSGIGKGHGWFGFETFSNARGVYKQHVPGAIEFLMPPYNNLKMKMIDWTIKWF